MRRKEKYEEYNGLFHNAIDYNVYHMQVQERILGALAGMAFGGIVFHVFFGIWILTVLSIPVCAVVGIKVYRHMLLKKRKLRLTMQFRDMLETVSASLGGGRNIKDAFSGACSEMEIQYGGSAEIVYELQIIRSGLDNNINIEVLLQDFARRSHDENVQNFADVFEVANRRGGNVRQIIYETKNVISDKIMIERDIQTLVSGKKNELNIMMVLPLIVVNQTKAMHGNTSDDLEFSLLVKMIAFTMFVIAYLVGRKIMDIRV